MRFYTSFLLFGFYRRITTVSDALHAYGQLYQLAVPLLYMWHQQEIWQLLEAEKGMRNQVISTGRGMDLAFCIEHDMNETESTRSRVEFLNLIENCKNKGREFFLKSSFQMITGL